MNDLETSDAAVRRYRVAVETKDAVRKLTLREPRHYSTPLLFEGVFSTHEPESHMHLLGQFDNDQIDLCTSLGNSNTFATQHRSALVTTVIVLVASCFVEQVFGSYLRIKCYGTAFSEAPIENIFHYTLPVYILNSRSISTRLLLKPKMLRRIETRTDS